MYLIFCVAFTKVVNVKEENIDLKSGMNEALQKGDFYKERYIPFKVICQTCSKVIWVYFNHCVFYIDFRNVAYTEQVAELQREKADREAELLADIEEKKSLIEYLQGQVTASSANGSEKKKRRFFQTKTTGPSSPMKTDSPTEDTY